MSSHVFLHTSNRMEELAGMLAETLSDPVGADPFAVETVIVQSRGMARWLSLQLADALGICLNVRFPFPRQALEEILEGLLPEWRGREIGQRETMLWKIWELLESLRDDARFRPLAHYLSATPQSSNAPPDPVKRIQLAERLTSLFDQYLLYRPDLLVEWENGRDPDDWQAILWRALNDALSSREHIGHAVANLRIIEDLAQHAHGEVPPRLCAFGISSFPPLFLEILRHYGRLGQAHIFLLQPTPAYWGDLVTRRRRERSAACGGSAVTAPVYLETGHPLVPSLARQGQDLLNLLIDFDFQQRDAGQRFQAPPRDSLLHWLQADIVDLIDRENPDSAQPKIVVGAGDTSIQIHSCHSPMREVEALQDTLLDCFQRDSTLQPRDVLVMIPAIEEYAPYLQAVFGCPEHESRYIPFSIVDRRPRSEHGGIDCWFRLLELVEGRFSARETVSLLESPPFRGRFGLTDRDTANLRDWVRQTGIRWGIDAAHRAEQGLPAVVETTWRSGLSQWILGYAMRNERPDIESSFDGVYPFDEIEGSNIDLLDRSLAAIEFILESRARLAGMRTLAEWSAALVATLDDLFGDTEEFSAEAEAIRASLSALRNTAETLSVSERLPLQAVRQYLEKTIEDTVSSGGFLSGGVTFCTLQPMRTIPARIICLLGMNDTAFPRNPQPPAFDRMRDKRRIGDRSVREDDRHLFLETVLSAREMLYLSYTGQSERDLSECPPSVLIGELLDHLDRAGQFLSGATARQALVRRHRLQPFHQDYFAGGLLFSYSTANAEACRRLLQGPLDPEPFFTRNLPAPEPEKETATLRRLIRFYRNPAAFFVRERLGLTLPQDEPLLEESESFSVDRRAEYSLKVESVTRRLTGDDHPDWKRFQARGLLPLGTPGLAVSRSVERQAERLAARIERYRQGKSAENRTIDLEFDGWRLSGEIGPFFGDTLVVFRPARVKPVDCVSAWIQHLAASLLADRAAATTALVGDDREIILPVRPDAGELLKQLLDWYWEGMKRPLPFFPASAYAFAAQMLKQSNRSPLQAAEKVFLGNPDSPHFSSRGEIEDPYVALCWSAVPVETALNPEFEQIAAEVFLEIGLFEGRSP